MVTAKTPRKRRKSAFSFDFEPIYKLDYTLHSRKPLKCMYMCMYALRRAHITHVTLRWYHAQISAQYRWARTFRPAYGRE